MDSVAVLRLEVWNQVHKAILSGDSREESISSSLPSFSWLPPVLGVPWLVCCHCPGGLYSIWPLLFACVRIPASFSYKDTTLIQYNPILTCLHLQRLSSQIKSHSQVLRVMTWTNLGGTWFNPLHCSYQLLFSRWVVSMCLLWPHGL